MGGEQSGDRPGNSVAREIRGQILVWIGIVGGALTIVNYWSNFVILDDSISLFTQYWALMLHRVWLLIGYISNVTIEKDIALTLSLYWFLIVLSAGTIIKAGIRSNIGENTLILIIGSTPIGIAIWAESFIGNSTLELISYAVLFILSVTSTILTLNIVLEGGVSAKLYTYFITWISLNSVLLPLARSHPRIAENLTAIMLLPAFVIGAMFVILPNRSFAKRVTFILIGVAIIFGLSEVSKRAGYLRTAATSIEVAHRYPKDLPQEQAALARGLSKVKPEPCRPVTKSTVVPQSSGRL
jgi:hypothetical protein